MTHRMADKVRENWPQVANDARGALALEETSIKAHYFLGLALTSMATDYDEGVAHLKRALDLCKEATVSYKDDIVRALLRARKQRWEAGRTEVEAKLRAAEALVEHVLQVHGSARVGELLGDAAHGPRAAATVQLAAGAQDGDVMDTGDAEGHVANTSAAKVPGLGTHIAATAGIACDGPPLPSR